MNVNEKIKQAAVRLVSALSEMVSYRLQFSPSYKASEWSVHINSSLFCNWFPSLKMKLGSTDLEFRWHHCLSKHKVLNENNKELKLG